MLLAVDAETNTSVASAWAVGGFGVALGYPGRAAVANRDGVSLGQSSAWTVDRSNGRAAKL